ncbi:MAG: YceI family protein [Myxococcota bacterium]
MPHRLPAPTSLRPARALVLTLAAGLASVSLAASVHAAEPAAAPTAGAGTGTGRLTEWAIDPTHARVGFEVGHMVVSSVEGALTKFSGRVLLDEQDPAKSRLAFTAEVASIDTGNADRDEHLRGPDFFDATKFPTIEFESTGISKTAAGYAIRGDLTIHGVTRPVTLDATLSEALTNPWGKQVRAARVMGKIKRQDFGLTWNKTLDQGGMLVGDEVSIDVKLELNK